MKRYSVSKARERLADLLNEADQGLPVIIERRDVRYVLRVEPASRPRVSRRSVIETLDPTIDAGQWRWNWTPKGVRFAVPRARA
jgi:hypothetical protein